ncbi:dimethylsulfonioproprionate lyase family protein [Ruegeria atlantica]|uniref:dimethylsulfonioproprionate lyase family protein n=1 Tax=Ruegeria atlantica TaxID=81569 RepID=UPI00147E415D|nr:dimethylsulfonioproprionate lyase family protein [Ruegeria atlantica]
MKPKPTVRDPLFRFARATSEHLLYFSQEYCYGEHKEFLQTVSTTLLAPKTTFDAAESRVPTPVRALKHMPKIFRDNSHKSSSYLQESAILAFGFVNWSEYFPDSGSSQTLSSEYAIGEGIGPYGTLRSKNTALGLFIIGPNTLYPPKIQSVAEYFIVLSGDAAFQVGADTHFLKKKSGDIIVHKGDQPYAIQTGDNPLFAVFGRISKTHY